MIATTTPASTNRQESLAGLDSSIRKFLETGGDMTELSSTVAACIREVYPSYESAGARISALALNLSRNEPLEVSLMEPPDRDVGFAG